MVFVGQASATKTVTYYYTDLQGSVLMTTDAQGNSLSSSDYRSFGSQVLGLAQAAPSFTGHVQDPDSGLLYMQARYYDPMAGRFLSVDPITVNSDDGASFNRYWYADNNPYRFTDPDGRCPLCVAAYVVIAVAVGAGTDYLAQKYMHPNQPVNKTEVAVSGAVSGLGAGTTLLATAAVSAGTVTVGTAVTVNVVANGAIGAAGRAVQGAIEGKPATTSQLVVAGVGNAAGVAVTNGLGAVLGDFSEAAAQGAIQNLTKAAVNSPEGIGSHIAGTTISTGNVGVGQSAGQAVTSQAAQAFGQQATAVEQQSVDNHLNQ